jgi:hypothetical protein
MISSSRNPNHERLSKNNKILAQFLNLKKKKFIEFSLTKLSNIK